MTTKIILLLSILWSESRSRENCPTRRVHRDKAKWRAFSTVWVFPRNKCEEVKWFENCPSSCDRLKMNINMAGQTINDRLLAARHSLAGQGLAKSVCKATTEEMIGPKKKHLDCESSSSSSLGAVAVFAYLLPLGVWAIEPIRREENERNSFFERSECGLRPWPVNCEYWGSTAEKLGHGMEDEEERGEGGEAFQSIIGEPEELLWSSRILIYSAPNGKGVAEFAISKQFLPPPLWHVSFGFMGKEEEEWRESENDGLRSDDSSLWYDDRGYKFIFTCLFSCAFKSAPIRIQDEIPIDSPLQL